jgi:phosphatidylinositol 4-kinase type 2
LQDDEMEVPIAVPLRMPSSEERRRHEVDLERGLDEDEMDIGNLVSSAPASREHDLLGLSPPSSQLPSALRLGTPHAQSSYDVERADGQADSEASSLHSHGTGIRSGALSTKSEPRGYPRPNHRSLVSYDSGMVTRGGRVRKAAWGGSMSGRTTRRGSHTLYSDDDADGDLGYSAVTGSEGARRRVIAERLEAVKSRNPVFTWC